MGHPCEKDTLMTLTSLTTKFFTTRWDKTKLVSTDFYNYINPNYLLMNHFFNYENSILHLAQSPYHDLKVTRLKSKKPIYLKPTPRITTTPMLPERIANIK